MSITKKSNNLSPAALQVLTILHKDNQLFIVAKPPGLAVQADKTGDANLQAQAEAYCHHPLHLVNRLDRPVSGIVVFAKNNRAMTELTEQFRQRSVEKTYLALVAQAPPEAEGTLVHFLRKNEAKNTSQVVPEGTAGAERAELNYRLLGSTERYHLLLVELVTGRHHQIRAQLAAIGSPVRGDVKYGFRRSAPDRSIALHAWRLAFEHPVSGERLELVAPPPEEALWQAVSGFLI
jgi:23S rRNA pseudouridine1911/1915/1917 synthase